MRGAIRQSKNLGSKQYMYIYSHYIIEYNLKSTNLGVNEHVHRYHTTTFRAREIQLQKMYRNYPMFLDTLCFRTPPIFHRNNYSLASENMIFGRSLFSDNSYFSPK